MLLLNLDPPPPQKKDTIIIMKHPEKFNWVVFKKKWVYTSKLFLFWSRKEILFLQLF